MNRRQFMEWTGGASLGSGLLTWPGSGRGKSKPVQALPYSEELPDMLVSFLSQKMNALAANWDREREKIRTPLEIADRNRFVRAKFIEMIHGYPARNPLNARIVRILERKGYRIECLMYQSQPDFWVTSSLYVPTTGQGPFPGIISPCGHSFNGRCYPVYQAMYQNLALNGFVILAPDPIGEGERREFWNPRTQRNEIGGPETWEHSLPGQQLLLLGENLTQYRVWDCMRGIDYLLSRPEVDPKRIGCAGQSGGGTLTKFVSALDERIGCAAIHEGGTANRWPLHVLPFEPLDTGDPEQHLFPGAIYGIDNVDLQVAIAPRPLLVTIEHYAAPFNAAARSILSRYRQLGVPERFRTVAANDPHSMTVKLRIANTDWFCRWFYNRPGPTSEPQFTIEPDQNLYCTPDGSVKYSHQGLTMFSIILRKQAKMPPETPLPSGLTELDAYRRKMASDIQGLLRFKRLKQPVQPRYTFTTPRKGYKIEKVEFLSGPRVFVSAWVFIPNGARITRRALLYFNDVGAAREGLEFGVLEQLVLKGQVVVAADVRGVGATKPPHLASQFRGEYRQLDDVETVMTYWAWAMNEELLGMRVQDVLRSIDYTLSRPDVEPEKLNIIGTGMGALWVLYASALDERVAAAVCHRGLISYRALTSADRYTHEASIFVRGALAGFDLCQVAAAAAPRRLLVLDPVDPMKAPAGSERAKAAYQWTQGVYEAAGAGSSFAAVSADATRTLADQYWDFLKD
ncbi:MAG: prolyl oligopeptidase family serine peptidase [Terriglobia bacterium]